MEFLKGIRVLDLSQYIPGPYAARLLADMGAEVLKIEPPSGDPMRSLDPARPDAATPLYDVLNGGKTVLRLDLKTQIGREALEDLIRGADVLIDAFRPGTLGRLGFRPERLRDLNPRLVVCALSGFGANGPLAAAAGHDLTYMALSGGLIGSGTEESPTISWPPVADHAGAMQAATTILGALLARERLGRGAHLDIALSDSVLSWQYLTLPLVGSREAPAERGQGQLNGGAAYYNIYPTQDGRFVALGALEPKFWKAFCETMRRPDWIARQTDPMPQDALFFEIREAFAGKPLPEWELIFEGVDCCFQPVLEYNEVANHPQIRARAMTRPHPDGGAEPLFAAWIDGEPPTRRAPPRATTLEAALAAWGEERRAP